MLYKKNVRHFPKSPQFCCDLDASKENAELLSRGAAGLCYLLGDNWHPMADSSPYQQWLDTVSCAIDVTLQLLPLSLCNRVVHPYRTVQCYINTNTKHSAGFHNLALLCSTEIILNPIKQQVRVGLCQINTAFLFTPARSCAGIQKYRQAWPA